MRQTKKQKQAQYAAYVAMSADERRELVATMDACIAGARVLLAAAWSAAYDSIDHEHLRAIDRAQRALPAYTLGDDDADALLETIESMR